MLTSIGAKPVGVYRPSHPQARPRFTGEPSSSSSYFNFRDKAVNGASSMLQETLSQAVSEQFINQLLENAEVKNVLKTIFTPDYVQELVHSSNIQDITKQELETLLKRDYLQKLLETSEAKKLLKETLSPAFLQELTENANLQGLAKTQIKTLLQDPEFQSETRQSIKKTLSLLIQDALPPLFQMSAGLTSITLGKNQPDKNVQAGLLAGGGYHLTQGAHKLLGIQTAPTSQMALGATSLLASRFLLPDGYQPAANLLGSISLASGVFGRYGNDASNQKLQGDIHHFANWESWKKIPVLGRLAALGEEWSQQNKLPKSSLHEAAQRGDLATVEQWLDRETDLNQPNANGRTALSLAAQGHPEIVNVLLSLSETDPNHADQNGLTALHHAILHKKNGITQALIKHEKTDVNHRDKDGRSPLHHAAMLGHEEIVKSLLSHEKIKPNPVDKDGWTPLRHASRNQHMEASILLVERDPKVGQAKAILAADQKKAEQSFRNAAEHGHFNDVFAWIVAGVNPNATRLDGKTPAHLAAENNHTSVVQLLGSSGADLNQPSLFGWTPLYQATQKGHLESVQALIHAGANVRQKNKNGQTPLQLAESLGYMEIAQVLKKADPPIQTHPEDVD